MHLGGLNRYSCRTPVTSVFTNAGVVGIWATQSDPISSCWIRWTSPILSLKSISCWASRHSLSLSSPDDNEILPQQSGQLGQFFVTPSSSWVRNSSSGAQIASEPYPWLSRAQGPSSGSRNYSVCDTMRHAMTLVWPCEGRLAIITLPRHLTELIWTALLSATLPSPGSSPVNTIESFCAVDWMRPALHTLCDAPQFNRWQTLSLLIRKEVIVKRQPWRPGTAGFRMLCWVQPTWACVSRLYLAVKDGAYQKNACA